MSNLLAALRTSANTLKTYDRVLAVTQNNVANASTPGYARQRLLLESQSFDLISGAPGGVSPGEIESTRNQYAEQTIRQQTALLGLAQQKADSLSQISSLFDVTGASGIPKALNNLLQSFSAWAQAPEDSGARQTVVDRATELAAAFRQTAGALENARQNTENELEETTTRVNELVGQLRGFNTQIFQGTRTDAGVDAQVNANLEELAQYVDFTARREDDGSVTILMNGQTPLLIGDRQYEIDYRLEKATGDDLPYPDAAPSARIYSADGTDITAQTTVGKLGALLEIRNDTIPSYLGDAHQAGDLNLLALDFAKSVNTLLESGHIIDDTDTTDEEVTPRPGVALFQYSTTDDTQVAKSLMVDATVGAEDLAAIAPGPPYVSNGIALGLSSLSSAKDMDGATYASFFGRMAGRAGSGWNAAKEQISAQQSLLAQAKEIRQKLSGVSLDEEATILMQFQRAYEANSKLLQVLDRLTEVAINILQR